MGLAPSVLAGLVLIYPRLVGERGRADDLAGRAAAVASRRRPSTKRMCLQGTCRTASVAVYMLPVFSSSLVCAVERRREPAGTTDRLCN
jgi:hypothetical protein